MNLVTGGSGLLGQALIELLLTKGEKVVAIYNKTSLKNFNSNLLIQKEVNILDIVALEEAMQGVAKVYHCAGLVSFNTKDKENLFKINIEGTANIVNACIDAKVNKLVHVSSVAALGRIRKDISIDETMNWTPETSNSIYGESKYLGEMEVWRGMAEGLNSVIINPSIILGEADWNNSSTAIFKNVYDEFGWFTTGSTGWVDVKDVAKVMLLLMQSDISEQRFIVSGYNETYQNVFNLIAKHFNKQQPNKKVSPTIASIVWRLEKLKSFFTNKKPLITKETASTAMAIANFNNKKLLTALPNFSYNNFENTLERICKNLQPN